MAKGSVCAHCGAEMPLRSLALTCSNACRQAAYRARRKAERAAAVPAELRARARWVRHAAKRPMRTDGKWASTTDPSTWSDYATARDCARGEGIGYVLAPGDGVVVVDLDHAVRADGGLEPWARLIVDALPTTFMERGRSGTGLHLWFRGELVHGRKIRRGEVALEVYGRDRYIILGDRVPGSPSELAELPDVAAVISGLVATRPGSTP
ncbi:bifunctional DNA primase/polymerase [Yinghuangia seranimata]|uniref:bifunctional DNA primase/polymerase n=1 Tax=Yinghuangia seranimata TaxID=408067 RepID=UPI00248BD583|nr:bifunctional DNA primase/polymerase [Yinghuangia seranimata]MDI2127952.1 bifunctional DNA primase/polymerase [Yinghuangia seranimata]